MKTQKTWRFVALAHVVLGSMVALAVACSGDDTTTNPGTVTGKDSGTPDTSVGPGVDTGTGNPDTGPQGVPPGCFAGTPVNSLDFQNACTTADYVVFDNCARLGLCNGAALPALVTPPVDAGVDAADAADAAKPDTGADAADGAITDAPADG